MSRRLLYLAVVCLQLSSILACGGASAFTPDPQKTPAAVSITLNREETIPEHAVKMSPEIDAHPPDILSPDFTEPVPVSGEYRGY